MNMGLDFIVYKGVTPAESIPEKDVCNAHGPLFVSIPTFFNDKSYEGMSDLVLVDENSSDEKWLVGAFNYDDTDHDTPHFSYSGWGIFRNALAQAFMSTSAGAVWKDTTGKYVNHPMNALINYSDCEGVMGPVACAEIAAAMEAGLTDGTVDKFVNLNNYYNEDTYRVVMDMFKSVGPDGFVLFC